MEEKLSSEKQEGEQALIKSLTLRSYLEGVTSLSDASEGLCSEGEIAEEQETYLQLHRKLEELREASAGLSRKKVFLE